MFYFNSTLNFEIPPALVFLLEVYYKVDRLLTDLTAQQIRTTARWYSNKTSPLSIDPLKTKSQTRPVESGVVYHENSEKNICQKFLILQSLFKLGNWL